MYCIVFVLYCIASCMRLSQYEYQASYSYVWKSLISVNRTRSFNRRCIRLFLVNHLYNECSRLTKEYRCELNKQIGFSLSKAHFQRHSISDLVLGESVDRNGHMTHRHVFNQMFNSSVRVSITKTLVLFFSTAHPSFSPDECFQRIDKNIRAMLKRRHRPMVNHLTQNYV